MLHLRNRFFLKRPGQRRKIFISVAVFMIMGGAIVCVLNILGYVQGPWSSIFGVFATVLGIVFTIPQGTLASSENPLLSSNLVEIAANQPLRRDIEIHGISLGLGENRGALIVKVNRQLCGSTIILCYGFDNVSLIAHLATNVEKYRIDGHSVFAAIFPSLEPGNYTVYIDSQEYRSKETIYAGWISVINWQKVSLKKK